MSRNLLQELVNEHALITEQAENNVNNTLSSKVKNELLEQLPIESSSQILTKFEEYNQLCFIDYENKLQAIINFFQAQEHNKQLIIDNLRNIYNNSNTFPNDISDDKLIDNYSKEKLTEFLNHQKAIDEFLLKNKIDLPNNIKNFYIELNEAVEIEYTNWLHYKMFNNT